MERLKEKSQHKNPFKDYQQLRRDLSNADSLEAERIFWRAEQEADLTPAEHERLCELYRERVRCDGCQGLVYENWPRGDRVARCFGTEGKYRGRVVHYSGAGDIVSVVRPAWCEQKGK